MKPSHLLVMRLVNMVNVHPGQDNTHVCSQCKEPVGIYPSGQYALRKDPELEIICNVCAEADSRPAVGVPAARSLKEFVQEHRDSIPVKKA